MPVIYGILSEEYCRFSEKLEDYKYKLEDVDLTPSRRDNIIQSIESIKIDMIFIEKAFRANNVSLPKVKTPISQSREGWTAFRMGIFTNE
jgi:hypothetical protein